MHIDYTINVVNLLALAAAIVGFIWGARKVLVKLYVMREETRLRGRLRELKRQQGGFMIAGFFIHMAVELSRQKEILCRLAPNSRDAVVMQDMAVNMIAAYAMWIIRLSEDYPEFQGLRVVSEANLKELQLDLAVERCMRISHALRFFDVGEGQMAHHMLAGQACALAFAYGSELLNSDELFNRFGPEFSRLLSEEYDYPPAEEVRPVLRALATKDSAEVTKLIIRYNRGVSLEDVSQKFASFMKLCMQGYQDEVNQILNRLRRLQTGTTLAGAD